MDTREAPCYLVDGPRADIERELEPRSSFRITRQCLLNAKAIVALCRGRPGAADLELSPRAEGEVRVSQERAAAFRAWAAR